MNIQECFKKIDNYFLLNKNSNDYNKYKNDILLILNKYHFYNSIITLNEKMFKNLNIIQISIYIEVIKAEGIIGKIILINNLHHNSIILDMKNYKNIDSMLFKFEQNFMSSIKTKLIFKIFHRFNFYTDTIKYYFESYLDVLYLRCLFFKDFLIAKIY